MNPNNGLIDVKNAMPILLCFRDFLDKKPMNLASLPPTCTAREALTWFEVYMAQHDRLSGSANVHSQSDTPSLTVQHLESSSSPQSRSNNNAPNSNHGSTANQRSETDLIDLGPFSASTSVKSYLSPTSFEDQWENTMHSPTLSTKSPFKHIPKNPNAPLLSFDCSRPLRAEDIDLIDWHPSQTPSNWQISLLNRLLLQLNVAHFLFMQVGYPPYAMNPEIHTVLLFGDPSGKISPPDNPWRSVLTRKSLRMESPAWDRVYATLQGNDTSNLEEISLSEAADNSFPYESKLRRRRCEAFVDGKPCPVYSELFASRLSNQKTRVSYFSVHGQRFRSVWIEETGSFRTVPEDSFHRGGASKFAAGKSKKKPRDNGYNNSPVTDFFKQRPIRQEHYPEPQRSFDDNEDLTLTQQDIKAHKQEETEAVLTGEEEERANHNLTVDDSW